MRKEVIEIQKYIGTYRVFAEPDLTTGKASKNEDDTYLKGKYKSQIYRYDENNLCIYFPSGKSSTNIVLPQLDDMGVKYDLYIEAETELIYIVSEKDIHKVNEVLHFSTKGKNVQAKSVKTARAILKKQEKEKEKQSKQNINKKNKESV